MQNNSLKQFYKWVILFTAFISIVLIKLFVIQRIEVRGNSMFPTFENGDMVIVDKRQKIKRYDIVTATCDGKQLLKRVVGLPNETIKISGGAVYINGQQLQADCSEYIKNGGIAKDGYVIGLDEYFLMGDNRNASGDSRNFGAVKRKNIKGIVRYQIYPFSKMGIPQ